jgi:hypothetical protein
MTNSEGPMKQQLRQRSTAAWAAAVAVSVVVLYGSQQALSPAVGAEHHAPSHAITLDATPLTQEEPVTACLTVTADVTGPADARLRANVLPGSPPTLSPGASVAVEAVQPGAASCETATTDGVVFHGPLTGAPDALTQLHPDRSTARSAPWSPATTVDAQTYRITLFLGEDARATQVTTPSVRFVWDVVPR